MTDAKLHLADFDYALPPELIAQTPAPRRDESRLLVLPRVGPVEHRRFNDVVELLRPGDLLVRNNAKVLPARLIGRRDGGGRAELLLLRPETGPGVRWRALAKPGKALRPGMGLEFGSLAARVEAKLPDGQVVVAFAGEAADFPARLAREGRMPLPPYIRRGDGASPETLARDAERYQTIYAQVEGAVAAPTAGLHFTEATFAAIAQKGVAVADLTLLVGAGTFLPIRTDDLDAHVMHAEWFDLPAATSAAIDACRARGGRVVAVGTTAARVLETLGRDDGRAPAGRGETTLFIKPGHRWRVVDALITNFHLPKSTLLVLVCALAGSERALAAYREAVAARYRFFSYGDACWIERGEGE